MTGVDDAELMSSLIDALTVTAAVLSTLAFVAYSLTARWWQTRSGTALWVIHMTIMLLLGHFVLEGSQGQVYWRELVLLVLLCAALLYWLFVVVYKRWFWVAPDGAARDDDQ